MKRSEDLLGLSIISIEDGKEIGRVSDLVVNPAKGTVEFLIMDNGSRYTGVKVLPFKMVEGVGEYAVTIQSVSSISDLADEPEVNGLLEKSVRVKGTKVLTKKGKLIGSVSEYIIDDENEGKIAGCEVTPVSGASSNGLIPAEKIVTFGKDVLIVNEDAEVVPPNNPTGAGPKPETGAPQPAAPAVGNKEKTAEKKEAVRQTDAAEQKEPVENTKAAEKNEGAEKQEPSQAAKLFEERQRQYLLGRKTSKRVESDGGEVIAEEGQLITEELLDKAKAAGKFTELSMNTKA